MKARIAYYATALLLLVLLAVGATYYQGVQIHDGYDPTYGNEIRYNTGTYEVPVMPASAMTGTIAYSVTTPFTVEIGTVPGGAVVTGVDVIVSTAFNAGTTNVLLVGTSTDPDHYVDDGDVLETAVTQTTVMDKAEQVTSDTTIYAKFTQTGTAATTGAARIVIHYALPGA